MAALTFAAVTGSLKAAADTVKSMIDLRDSTLFLAKANELQRQISTALADAISAYEAQSTNLQRIRDLEEKVTQFETWNTEKQRYELKKLPGDAYAYMLKPNARGAEPPHWLCANCYGGAKASIFQWTPRSALGRRVYACPACKSEIAPVADIKWMD